MATILNEENIINYYQFYYLQLIITAKFRYFKIWKSWILVEFPCFSAYPMVFKIIFFWKDEVPFADYNLIGIHLMVTLVWVQILLLSDSCFCLWIRSLVNSNLDLFSEKLIHRIVLSKSDSNLSVFRVSVLFCSK